MNMEINSTGAAPRAMPIGLATRPTPPPATASKVAPAATVPAAEASKIDQVQLEAAVKAINAMLAPVTNAVTFSIDQDSGKTVVKLLDNQTNEVIRQFPSKEMLAIAKDMTQYKGLLIFEKS